MIPWVSSIYKLLGSGLLQGFSNLGMLSKKNRFILELVRIEGGEGFWPVGDPDYLHVKKGPEKQGEGGGLGIENSSSRISQKRAKWKKMCDLT